MKTLQVEDGLTEVSRGVVKLAIKASIAHLINYKGYHDKADPDNDTVLRQLAAKRAVWAARKLYGWGTEPWEKGADFEASGWYGYACSVRDHHRANAEWKNADWDAIKPVKDQLITTIDEALVKKGA